MKILIALLITLVVFGANISAQTTAFTYQGKLTDRAVPATGVYTMRFDLFAGPSGGTALATQTIPAVQVTNGIFTVNLDFGGGVFDGSNRYLEITVGSTTLSPRQQITSAPYSVQSLNATNAAQLGGVAANQYLTITNGNASYIQNQNAVFQPANFSINGTGTANIVNATTQYNIGGNRVLSSSGTNNIFAGVGAGQNNTANDNSFFGKDAGKMTSTGDRNAFFGSGAGVANTIGFANAFVGQISGASNTEGSSNAFVGYGSGVANTIGSGNSFFGTFTGERNTEGYLNSFFGSRAGAGNITGGENTLIGNDADVTSPNLFNAIAIGANAKVGQSNSLVLGNGVNVGIGTTSPANKLHIHGGGLTFSDPGGFMNQNRFSWINFPISTGVLALEARDDANAFVRSLLAVQHTGNVGIGTTAPLAKLHVQGGGIRVVGGPIFIAQPSSLIITSPNGNCWFITVSDTGVVSSFNVTCP